MKAQELMIGDWVLYNNMPHIIHTLTAAGETRYETPNDLTELTYDDCKPIPLTAEILEKNGFTQSRVGWHKKTYGAWEISVYLAPYAQIEITNYCGRGTDCEEVNYGSTIELDHNLSIHELQHALRLCGLNELADNFKI